MVTAATIVPNIPNIVPAPKYIPRLNASMSLFAKPNDIHQADILYLPHDRYEKKVYKYALKIMDVASRYKGSYQLKEKHDVIIQRGDPSQHRSQGIVERFNRS